MTGGALALLALLVVAGSGAAWFHLAFRVALPHDRRGFVAVWLVGVALAIAALLRGTGGLGTAAAVVAGLGAGFFLFTVAISRQQAGADAIRVGDPLPDVDAPDEDGRRVALADFRGQPLLLKFFRGHW